jgi:hypothetical protein
METASVGRAVSQEGFRDLAPADVPRLGIMQRYGAVRWCRTSSARGGITASALAATCHLGHRDRRQLARAPGRISLEIGVRTAAGNHTVSGSSQAALASRVGMARPLSWRRPCAAGGWLGSPTVAATAAARRCRSWSVCSWFGSSGRRLWCAQPASARLRPSDINGESALLRQTAAPESHRTCTMRRRDAARCPATVT